MSDDESPLSQRPSVTLRFDRAAAEEIRSSRARWAVVPPIHEAGDAAPNLRGDVPTLGASSVTLSGHAPATDAHDESPLSRSPGSTTQRLAVLAPEPMPASRKLAWRIRTIDELHPETVDAMWGLFSRYYADVSRERFEEDLRAKDSVILLRDEGRKLRGFSTLLHMEGEIEGEPFGAVFSGDTIVHHHFWGQTALQQAFFRHLVAQKLRRPFRPLWWFLISKGYKTYLLLARNFPTYWPRFDRPTPERELALLDALARAKYPEAWVPELGILRFPEKLGRLRGNVAPIGAKELEDPHIRYFVERNPGHATGDELVCAGRIDLALCSKFLGKMARKKRGAT
jgi:hypothetical protein